MTRQNGITKEGKLGYGKYSPTAFGKGQSGETRLGFGEDLFVILGLAWRGDISTSKCLTGSVTL